MKTVIFILLSFVALISAQLTSLTQFSAGVQITQPTTIGRLTGTLHYDGVNSKILIAYNFAGATNVFELYDYRTISSGQVRYIWCPNDCDADNLGVPLPIFYKLGTDSAASTEVVVDKAGNSRTCTKFTRSNDPVTSLSFDNDGPCKINMADGRVFSFSGGAKTFQSNAFAGLPPSYCPAKTCGIKLDVFQVLDESGSIDSNEWKQLKSFSAQVVNGFRFDQLTGVGMGIVTFSSGNSIESSARLKINLSFSQTNVLNVVNALIEQGGSTCVSCGSQVAIESRAASPLKRDTATKTQIVVTDGANNLYTSNMNNYPVWRGNSAGNADYRNWIFFAIGVGSTQDLDTSQLLTIAGDTSRRIITPDFNSLQTLVNTIVTQTCVLTGSFSCPNCKGFCVPTGCNGPCICADCEDFNPCTIDTCTNPALGCTYSANPCNDGDLCTYDQCTPASGCTNPAKVLYYGECVDVGMPEGVDNLCTTDGCRSNSGCYHDAIQCDDYNACTDNNCNPNTGCVFTPNFGNCQACNQTGIPVDCSVVQSLQKCNIIECDPTVQTTNYPDPNAQCKSKGPKVCDDNNPCTIDTCDDATGDCVFTPVNQTIFCDDQTYCTWDVCDATGQQYGLGAGCQHIPIDCNDGDACTDEVCEDANANVWDDSKQTWTGCKVTPHDCDDQNVCTIDSCDSTAGCLHVEKDCSQDPVLAGIVGSCYTALCDPFVSPDINTTLFISEGCYLSQIINTTVNKCGRCCGGELNPHEYQDCVSGGGCGTATKQDNTLAVGGLFLAAILIAIIAICIVIGLLAGKKGYDIYLRNKNNMTGANTSPLYTADGLTGTNALYEAPNH